MLFYPTIYIVKTLLPLRISFAYYSGKEADSQDIANVGFSSIRYMALIKSFLERSFHIFLLLVPSSHMAHYFGVFCSFLCFHIFQPTPKTSPSILQTAEIATPMILDMLRPEPGCTLLVEDVDGDGGSEVLVVLAALVVLVVMVVLVALVALVVLVALDAAVLPNE